MTHLATGTERPRMDEIEDLFAVALEEFCTRTVLPVLDAERHSSAAEKTPNRVPHAAYKLADPMLPVGT